MFVCVVYLYVSVCDVCVSGYVCVYIVCVCACMCVHVCVFCVCVCVCVWSGVNCRSHSIGSYLMGPRIERSLSGMVATVLTCRAVSMMASSQLS